MPRLRLPRAAVAGEVRRHVPAGHVDRPAADLEGLPAGRPRGRGRRLRPRRHRQGQRPVPLPAGRRGPRTRASRSSPPGGSRSSASKFPGRSEMIAYCQQKQHPGQGLGRQALQLRRELPAHQLRGRQAGRPDGQRRRTGRVRHDASRRSRPRTRSRTSRSASRRACRSASTASSSAPFEIVTRAERDRRPQRHRPDRHGREPLRGHEEPRRLRSARHDDPLRGPSAGRAADAGPRPDAPPRPARARKWPRWSTTASGTTPRWTP